MRLILIALIVLGTTAPADAAKRAGNPVAGKDVAKKFCAECHDTTGNAKPHNPPGNAPPFIALTQQTPEDLRRYLNLPHGTMVNLMVTGRDADDVVAYIVSLRHR